MFHLMQNSCQTNVIKWRRDFDPELVSLSENWGRGVMQHLVELRCQQLALGLCTNTLRLCFSCHSILCLPFRWKVKVQGQKLSGFLEMCASHKAFSSALRLIGRDLKLTNICELLFYVTVHCSSAYLLEENCSCFSITGPWPWRSVLIDSI